MYILKYINNKTVIEVKIFGNILLVLLFVAGLLSCSRTLDPVDYVDPYIGNISHILVPVYPTVHLPNSMVRAVPMRKEYTDCRLSGLPVLLTSHRGAQAFCLCPWNSAEGLDSDMSYRYDNEKVTPYRYEVYLETVQTEVSYAPSRQSAVYGFEFLSEAPNYIVAKSFDGALSADGEFVRGYQNLDNGTVAYFCLEAGCADEIMVLSEDRVALRFDRKNIELRYGVSYISEDQAQANLQREVSGRSLDEVAMLGRRIWNESLSKVRVSGGTESEKKVFYTSMYRIAERPVDISEDGRYFSAYDGKVHVSDRPFYVDDWYWDTYRAAHPFRTLTAPDMEMDMVNSSVVAASLSDRKWLPVFPLVTGDSHSMNCNHGIAVIADCLSKGLDGFDVELAYEVCRNAVTDKSLAPWSLCEAGELDEFYHRNGYYPALCPGEKETVPQIHPFEKRQPVAVTLGTAYDQWCLSNIAGYAGKKEDSVYFRSRSLDYRNLFNSETGFFHPKDASGNFITPFDYCTSGGLGFRDAYDENNGWIYRWDVQHNIADLIDLMGGPEKFVSELDYMFETGMKADRYGFWAQGPDHSALVGHFSMGNEPCLHIPYLYNYAGQPWKTQKRTRELLKMWFRDDLMGMPGDEDGGGLSSFAVFSMMGFYPVTPGLPVYALTSPVFKEIVIDIGAGKTFKVKCDVCSPDHKYIRSAKLNGKDWNKSWISHEDIVNGGVLEVSMGRYPDKNWAADGCPPSFGMSSGRNVPVSVPDPQYADFNYGQNDNGKHTEWVQSINVVYPECRSEVKGKVKVTFEAPGMTGAKAMLWRQPVRSSDTEWGSDEYLTPKKGIRIDPDGVASFSFNADRFPSGPMNVRIYAWNDSGKKDFFELQLYNTGGVSWNQGIPDRTPSGAEGLKLVFSDDFDGPLSISNDGIGARYNAHKPRFGDFSGWQFADADGPDNPFSQQDTYLRIAARKKAGSNGSSGLIASVNMDGEGFWVKAPCYLECRFTAQSAPGTWPAFWTITGLDRGSDGDELDIIEAYGGVGPGNPNHPGYSICSHFWGQTNPDGSDRKHRDCVVPMMEIGGRSYWSTTFHTYAVRIDIDDTIYYCDDIEVFRHPTNDVSRDRPHLFLINYAIGGISGWGIDLERYGNGSDMYVDYVRVYAENEIEYSIPRPKEE